MQKQSQVIVVGGYVGKALSILKSRDTISFHDTMVVNDIREWKHSSSETNWNVSEWVLAI